MKRALQVLCVGVVLLLGALAVMIYDRVKDIGPEYETAAALKELMVFAEENDGRWPSTANDLGGKYPVGGDVMIDYGVTSAQIIERPELLKESIRLKSGTFRMFPHYNSYIEILREVIVETNREQDEDPNHGAAPENSQQEATRHSELFRRESTSKMYKESPMSNKLLKSRASSP
jgi:hypothetical protein